MENLGIEDRAGRPELLTLDESDDEVGFETMQVNVKKISKKTTEMNNIFSNLLKPKSSTIIKKVSKGKKNEEDIDMDDTYIDMGCDGMPIDSRLRRVSNMDEVMNKSVIVPGFDRLHAIPPYEVSQQTARKERKKEREKTKGSDWFNLPAPEMTDDLKKELQVLQMRAALDPKHFYKKNTMKTLPKYFQVGRIVEAPADFYHSRVPKKERKKTMVEELLADSQFKKYNKKRYKEIIEERRKTSFKAHKHAKRLKNRKK